MILWTVKLLGSVRRAIAGRKYPHQLAWAVAFGLMLGIVPHGNLLAIGLLVVVLSLRINHAMAGLTAVGATFLATKLDPYSHDVGEFVLTHPRLSDTVASVWQLPLMPWTDLNNTVVLGSFLIGVGALVPVFAATYPVFRWLAPSESESDFDADIVTLPPPKDVRTTQSHPVMIVDAAHQRVPSPYGDQSSETISLNTPVKRVVSDAAKTEIDFSEIGDDSPNDLDNRIAVETRIDVIRMKDHRGTQPDSLPANEFDSQQPMDEALNYLLRQLRDSQQRKAA